MLLVPLTGGVGIDPAIVEALHQDLVCDIALKNQSAMAALEDDECRVRQVVELDPALRRIEPFQILTHRRIGIGGGAAMLRFARITRRTRLALDEVSSRHGAIVAAAAVHRRATIPAMAQPPRAAAVSSIDRRRRWRRVVPLIAALLAIAAIEVMLRKADAAEPQMFVEDPELSWELNPSQGMWAEAADGIWLQTNSDSMRDREHGVAAAPNTRRIAVLGDSFMMGFGVAVDAAFPRMLEKELRGCGAAQRAIEVLNFGVSGYGTGQELLQYRKRVLKYQPDIVLLSVYAGNDIYNNHPALDDSGDLKPPYFAIGAGGPVRLPPHPQPDGRPEPWHRRSRLWLTDRLRTARLIYDGYATVRSSFSAPSEPAAGASSSAIDILKAPGNAAERAAWEVTEGLIGTIASEVESNRSEFWLVTLSIAEQVDPEGARREALARALGVADLWYPDRRLQDFATRAHLRVIGLAEPMAAYALREQASLHKGTAAVPDVHWNARGHAVAAAIAAERLCRDSAVLALRQSPLPSTTTVPARLSAARPRGPRPGSVTSAAAQMRQRRRAVTRRRRW